MRRLILIVCFAFLSFACSANAATQHDQPTKPDQRIEQAIHDISLLKDSQTELRRDQLNYKIEKDILKESYNSSLQTLNLSITFILGLFAILGYLGIRDIGTMKKEYSDHLEKLGVLKQRLEIDIEKINTEQVNVREELTRVLEVNKQQDNKLKVLELQDQVMKLFNDRAFERAYEYITIGLEIAHDDYKLLLYKAFCLMKFMKFEDAVVIFKKLLHTFPEHPSTLDTILNLAETYLLSKDIEAFDSFIASRKMEISKVFDGAPLVYFEILKALITSEPEKIKASLTSLAKSPLYTPQKKWMPGWDYTDANKILLASADETTKVLYNQGISFINGSINAEQLLKSYE